MLGEKLKELRESNGLLQRQVATFLDVDTAYISKMESNCKPVSRNQLNKLAIIYKASENKLVPFWIAERILKVLNKEASDRDALLLVLESLNK